MLTARSIGKCWRAEFCAYAHTTWAEMEQEMLDDLIVNGHSILPVFAFDK